MQISATVCEKLFRLRNLSGVRFDSVRKCFIDENGNMKRGLTTILSGLIPVASDTDATEHRARRSRARQGKNDPIFVARRCTFNGATMRRCGTCVEALAHGLREPVVAEILRGESDDKAHGLLVDYQLGIYVALGGRNKMFAHCVVVDPCVGTLLEQFDENGWSIVGSQLPLYSPSMDVATACDLVAATRPSTARSRPRADETILIEVKASMRTDTSSDVNYERVRGRNTGTALRGVLQSYASRHQFQLLCTNLMVNEKCGFKFDHCCVMRASPGVVRTYDLHPWFVAKLPKVVDAISLKTGKKKRIKKRADALRVVKAKRKRGPKKSIEKGKSL